MSTLKRVFLLSVFVGLRGRWLSPGELTWGTRASQRITGVASPILAGPEWGRSQWSAQFIIGWGGSFESPPPQLKSVWFVLQIATHSPQRFTLRATLSGSSLASIDLTGQFQASFGAG